jgi:IS30 family transposase
MVKQHRFGPGRPLGRADKLEVMERLERGETWDQVAAAVRITHQTINRVRREHGGVKPRWRDRSPRHLCFAEREEISRGLALEQSFRQIAATLARSPSTVAREVNRNGGRIRYRARTADWATCERARRPKPTVFQQRPRLAAYVEAGLEQQWSPTQISAMLVIEHPDDETMRVSPETIYQTLFVQARGGLRKELAAFLRSGRATRRPRSRATTARNGFITNKVMISQRPAEIDDRAVPGHWEGDLIIGRNGKSQIATLVERSTRFVMLVKIDSKHADHVADQLAHHITTLPDQLTASLTWDQGVELAGHQRFTIATGIPVYFCDPASPWQRGSNENTNGLLRQYFPKGTDLSVHDQHHLDHIAHRLNTRPRQTLNWLTPSQAINQLLH